MSVLARLRSFAAEAGYARVPGGEDGKRLVGLAATASLPCPTCAAPPGCRCNGFLASAPYPHRSRFNNFLLRMHE